MKNIFKLLCLLITTIFGIMVVNAEEKNLVNIYLFHSNTCPHCQEEITALNDLSQTFSNIKIYKYEISENGNFVLMSQVANLLGITVNGVPFTIIGDKHFIGFNQTDIKDSIINAIEYYSNNTYTDVVGNYLNNNTQTTEPTTTKPIEKSKNNNLSTLSISPIKIDFNKDTTNYTVTVENKINSVTIDAKPEDEKATISGTGNKKLNVYMNTFQIIVTAENGSKKTYTIKINRKDDKGSTDNYLKELTIDDYEINPKFNKDILEYNLTVDNSVSLLKVNAQANDKNASLKIDNPKELNVGINVITITVTGEDKSARVYTINVNKKHKINNLNLEEIMDIIDDNEINSINVNISDNNTKISSEILAKLKQNGKTLNANYYDESNNLLYSWLIYGNSIDTPENIDTKITFYENDKNIEKLIKNAEAIYLDFAHSGLVPTGSTIKVYVGNKYSSNDLVNLYHYDESNNKIEKITDNLKVVNGYIEFSISHCSKYIITKYNIDKSNFNITTIIIIAVSIILLCLISYIIYSKVKPNKKKIANPFVYNEKIFLK